MGLAFILANSALFEPICPYCAKNFVKQNRSLHSVKPYTLAYISAMDATHFAFRIREVFLQGTWVANTNYQHLLEMVSLQHANVAAPNSNSVGLLVFHVHYYVNGLLRVFQGQPLDMHDHLSMQAPALHSEAEWNARKQQLFSDAEALANAVASKDQHWLEAPFVDARYGSNQRNIEALIEHAWYHLGQIRLLYGWAQAHEN